MRVQIQSTQYPAWMLWLMGVPLAITAVVLAVFFFTFFVIFFALALSVVALRIWWLRRKLRRAPSSQDVIEGEYTVVHKSERRSGSRQK